MATKGTRAKDAIAVLKQDHRAIESLFEEFERTGEKEKRRRKKLVKQIVEELSMHAQIEEQVFYPEVLGTAKEKTYSLSGCPGRDVVLSARPERPGERTAASAHPWQSLGVVSEACPVGRDDASDLRARGSTTDPGARRRRMGSVEFWAMAGDGVCGRVLCGLACRPIARADPLGQVGTQ